MSYRLKRKQKIHFIAQKRHGIQMGLTDVQQSIKKHYYTNPKGQTENTTNIYIYTFTYFMFLKSLMHIVISFE